jgi:2-octaprenyl-6-methoxyphenol hydroxylase
MSARIRIDGHGPVASALALFLLEEGFSGEDLTVESPRGELPEWLGSRAIALSLGSLEMLAPMVPQLHPRRLASGSEIAAPIDSVVIMRAGALGRSLIETGPDRHSCLGAVMRYRSLHRLLNDALASRGADGGFTLGASDPGPELNTGSVCISVRADGEAGDSDVRDFDQHALIAEVKVTGGRPGRAWERFTRDGPLALLPLPGHEGMRRALVWCAPPEIAVRRCRIDEQSFNRELLDAFGTSLGRLEVEGPRFSGPVQRRAREPRIEDLTVAIGNAAQALHPVAGQGLNLGLRDARVLARCLGDAKARLGMPGMAGGVPVAAESGERQVWIDALDRYGRARRPDRRALIGITDGLASLTRLPELALAQSAGLALMEMCPPLKRLARRVFTHGFRRL